jgi:hypothetical protein
MIDGCISDYAYDRDCVTRYCVVCEERTYYTYNKKNEVRKYDLCQSCHNEKDVYKIIWDLEAMYQYKPLSGIVYIMSEIWDFFTITPLSKQVKENMKGIRLENEKHSKRKDKLENLKRKYSSKGNP